MKRLMVMVAVVVAGYAAVAAAVEFLGIEVGGTLNVQDAKVREKVGVGEPVTVVLANEKFTYWQCDSKAPKGGYDEFGVMVSTNNVVIGVSASVDCPDEKTATEKKEKIFFAFKAKYASRLSPNGEFVLNVVSAKDASGKAYVDVDLSMEEFKSVLGRNNMCGKHSGKCAIR